MKMMLKLLLIILLLPANNLYSQSSTDSRKFIEVTGSAEKMIRPDEIELEIVLTEYKKDAAVVRLENIEKEFYTILKQNNIDTDVLHLDGLASNDWWYWWSNRNKILKTKTFKLSIHAGVDFLKLAADLDKKWVESMSVIDKKNKNIQEYRREVKIAAIKAAKEKASYLLESIGEHLGGVISVEENPEQNGFFYPARSRFTNVALNAGAPAAEEINNVSSIKLRYDIKVRFEIK